MAKAKHKRHSCSKCGSVRNETVMKPVRKTAKRTFWECLDCDSNRKANPLPPGWVVLHVTYIPPLQSAKWDDPEIISNPDNTGFEKSKLNFNGSKG